MAMNAQRAFTWVHKWIGLALGVQITLWLLSGLVMVLYDIEAVRGEHLAVRGYSGAVEAEGVLPAAEILAAYDGDAEQVALRPSAGRMIYVVDGSAGEALIDARTGQPPAELDEAQIAALAVAAYRGEGALARTILLTEAPIEWRSYTPVWRAEFDDRAATRLYLHPVTGDVATVRTRLWRVYDVMWMLHIMDYRTRDDFNNPLVKLAAGFALAVAISGLALLVYRILLPLLRRRRRMAAAGG